MANLYPFKALFYNQHFISNLARVCVPPYDVISAEEHKQFLKKSPYNFVRIILGKDASGYQHVKDRFERWQKDKVIISDQGHYFYYWVQHFRHQGKRWTRKGLVGCSVLDDFKTGKILPHENTLAAPKADRLEILKACKANLTPIFMMYEDPRFTLDALIAEAKPKRVIRFRDADGIVQEVWKLTEKRMYPKLQNFFQEKEFFILDGHHRFATALNYQERHRQVLGSNRVMTFVTNRCDPGLVVYPIYRLLKPTIGFDSHHYLESLKEDFKIEKSRGVKVLKAGTWGVMFQKDPYFYSLTAKHPRKLRESMKVPSAIRPLDITVLDHVILPPKVKSLIEYKRGMPAYIETSRQQLRQGKLAAMWFVRAPSLKELVAVSREHTTMPPKSTYFYPKLLSGVLIRHLLM